ncbi:MAG: tRNA preQ1(34) S-adenosylmethionine ribosyltransferase-isomerase QueA [Betaproteobacteria bacterium]|nr:MAG: tRNA preQ1(34) S-adenosylmethionine ribosyltransferase-isomerase QueA [Betaproteobacteria bacterium]
MLLSDFDYELPEDLIAQAPLPARRSSRLMYLDGASGVVSDHRFEDLTQFFRRGDLMVFNDTKVIKARLFGVKDSGGKVEIMIDRVLDSSTALAMLRASRTPKPGQTIKINEHMQLRVVSRENDLFVLEFPDDVFSVLDRCGQVPLPPYIGRSADATDEARYQTVYARQPGAVAAPTAGLHFDQQMMERLQRLGVDVAYVTLHVGAGTFQPVRVEDIDSHVMHAEWYHIPQATVHALQRARSQGGRVCAVGTTSLRALESAAAAGEVTAGSTETNLFIRPGFRFKVVQRLLTNFHLPRSTLLMLVAAFAGLDNVMRAYRHAVQERYRFFSYGDAMLVEASQPLLLGCVR